MTVLEEGELRFEFGDPWRAEEFDVRGRSFPPKGVLPVDFVAESDKELVLVEVKDPSASGATEENRRAFVRDMEARTLTHSVLTPKARTSYGYLHLMARDMKPMRYVVVIGIEGLSMQPALLMSLTDCLRGRLEKETDTAWKRKYLTNCMVVSVADFSKALPGCSAHRTAHGSGGSR